MADTIENLKLDEIIASQNYQEYFEYDESPADLNNWVYRGMPNSEKF